ncbi:dynamin family protein [Metabacillus sp. RGM 3146]|uniref:dynamin family protein n=1 Tax=Metabacillus sp. RGM 3146 TaxID=3401092 RepID=UPI003B9BEE8B
MQAINNKESISAKLMAVYEAIDQYDHETAVKVGDLIRKTYKEEKQIAFTGHFSAGKSSMINVLMGENILPTSPIPTSANLVLLQKGKKRVELTLRDGSIFEIKDTDYSSDKVQHYCRQGEAIEKVYIWDDQYQLPEHVIVMDTPGIDSTDEAHFESTESALHTADLIFYVTDYNHVQSEITLSFIKKLIDRQMDVYLLVNQIDKHKEEELPFDEFKKRINASFSEISLPENRIYYTSLLNETMIYNQLPKVKYLVQKAMEDDGVPAQEKLKKQLAPLIEEHISRLEQEKDVWLTEEEEMKAVLQNLAEKRNSLMKEYDHTSNELEAVIQSARDSIRDVVKNANIMPFEIREKASAYLESVQHGFKTGLLFSKAKTASERQKRHSDFLVSLTERITSQIDWHFIDLFKKTAELLHSVHPGKIEEIQGYSSPSAEQAISETIKSGAPYNAEYVMNYSRELGELIKRNAQNKALNMAEDLAEDERKKREAKMKGLKQSVSELNSTIEQTERKMTSISWVKHQSDDLKELLNKEIKSEAGFDEWLLKSGLLEKKKIDDPSILDNKESVKGEKEIVTEVIPAKDAELKEIGPEAVSAILFETAEALSEIKGFRHFIDSANEKANRLKNREFTIALFGAFSAGKSSFANALLGERLLPSSPTPTTAAINKIKPVTEEKSHGFVEVIMKNKTGLLADLNSIMAPLNTSGSTLEEALIKAEALLAKSQLEEHIRVQLALYTRVLRNPIKLESIGKTIISDTEHFKTYVAVEEEACLVEEVLIYYDCPLTRKGITLVDTPGADSLHKRHTEVAFKFIKEADAILFVTYYNHPFSKGDREFLKQLGRVKDAFSLDKMFFIVNAADLAKNEEELTLVKKYIEGQLLEHQIRFPRLYGVSSLSEMTGTAPPVPMDFGKLKQDLDRFIDHDLLQTTIRSSIEEMKSIQKQLTNFINEMNQDEESKAEQLSKLKISEEKAIIEIKNRVPQQAFQNVQQEITEQLYFVKQRVEFQFSDFFKEAFHPGAFYNKGNSRAILIACLEELIRSLEFRLIQELQAVSLRIEKKANTVMENERNALIEALYEIHPSFAFSSINLSDMATPPIHPVLEGVQPDAFQKELNLFKNARSFFEKNEKAIMSEALLKKLDGYLAVGLDSEGQHFTEYYAKLFEAEFLLQTQTIEKEIHEFFEAVYSIYTSGTELSKMIEAEGKLEHLTRKLIV